MAKLITLDNLDQAVKRLLQLINTKLGIREKAEVSSLQIDDIQNEEVVGSVNTEYDSLNHDVIFTYDENGDETSTVLPLPDSSERGYTIAVLENAAQELQTHSIATDLLGCNNGHDAYTVYALPGANSMARLIANGRVASDGTGGGGIILTTRYRSFEKRNITIDFSAEETDFNIEANAYTQVSFNSSGTIPRNLQYSVTLKGALDGKPCEHWIEINIPELSDSELDFTFNYNMMPDAEGVALRWANGSPNWNVLKGNIVQIHSVNGIATWNVANSNIYNELSDKNKVVFDGFATSQLTQIYTEGTFVYDRTKNVFKLGVKVSENQIQVINIQPDKYHIYFNRSDNKFYLYSNNSLEEVGVIGGGVSPSPSFDLFDVSSTGNGIVTITAGENNYDINLNHSHPEYLKAKILANETAYQSETKQNDVLYIVKGSTPKVYLGTIALI